MHKKTFIALIITCIGLCAVHVNIGEGMNIDTSILQDGSTERYILFTPELSKNTYLVNDIGEPVHTWESEYFQGLPVYLLDNGDLIRSDSSMANPVFAGGGFTGRVEKFNWKGELIWEFVYSNEKYCLHHDIEPLPNGNILMVAWEKKNDSEVIAAGRKPHNLATNVLWPDHIIEVEPYTDAPGGKIVWEWHVWDHLIQDYDPTKDNYGNVSQHPELIDINCVTSHGGSRSDWNHINSIDYNTKYDQILLSVDVFSEIWIIDHSTTTDQAKGHAGGRYGKGGDLLYRWGNPHMYRAGGPYDQKLFGQHDAQWIEPGCQGEGNILVYNNGVGRPDGAYSSIEEIVTPIDSNGSYYLSGYRYGPENPIWIYTADAPNDFYSSFLSGAQRLPNGNTLICDGPRGFFFEVTPDKETVWEYLNPYPNLLTNYVFKIHCYYLSLFEPNLTCNHTLKWLERIPGETITGTFSFQNDGGFDSFLDWKIESWPDWGQWVFSPISGENLTRGEGIFNVDIELIVPTNGTNPFTGDIKIVNRDNSDDFALIPVYVTLDFVPHLWCNGSLNWTDIIPGDTVFSNISVKNIGALGSLLNWKVESWPEWGNWTFLPSIGKNLTTTNESLNLTVLVTAPLIAEKEFTGYVKLVNMENNTNYCLLNVSLVTSYNPNNSPPIADFHWLPTNNINTHEEINFIDDSIDNDGTIIAWQWDFDDDTSAKEQNPQHAYDSMGTYTIILTVTDNNGSQSSKTKQLTITNLSPQADAGLDQIINTTRVMFDGTGSQDPDGEIILYAWYFGDGTNTTGPHVTHNYSTDGVYIVTLIVTDDNGATTSDTCIITIDTIPPQTTLLINGTTGERYWYTSTVAIQLHCNDTLSGLYETYYQTNFGEWKIYKRQLNFTSEGIQSLFFYSIDRAGNTEELQNVTIKIDKTPPLVRIILPKEGYLHIFGRAIIPTLRDRTLIIGGIMIEATITSYPSGIYNVTFYIDDILEYVTSQPPYTWKWEKGFGKSTLKVVCSDNAGHSHGDETNVIIFSIQ